jgi:hypothetical protein
MTKKEYFSQLFSLYEAVSAENVDQFQQEIADTGSDIADNNIDPKGGQEVIDPNPKEQSVESDNDLNDAAYLQNSASDDASIESDNREKLVELFELMEHLLNYAESFTLTLDDISYAMLEEVEIAKIKKYRLVIKKLAEKVNVYLTDIFKDQSYEKNLYAYVMLRTELLTTIKLVRSVLNLNEVEK